MSEWTILKSDGEISDFSERHGHSFASFGSYVLMFGGVGPYLKSIHRKNSYNDLVIYDFES